jgi:integron integrase
VSAFIESVREEIRTRHYSLKTEKAYLAWIKQYIRFHDTKHPRDMGKVEIEHFLSYLANQRKVSASTQSQALCAIIFVYNNVLKIDISDLKYGYAKKPKKLPTVIDRDEASRVLALLPVKYKLIASLLYGSGLRISEALRLRVKDIDFTNNTVFIFRGKGAKDRYSILPEAIVPDLLQQIRISQKLHERDLKQGNGVASLPMSLIKKYKTASKDTAWQYIFPSSTICRHPVDGYYCRHHLNESSFRKHLRVAVLKSKIPKRITAHTFRHTFATQLLLNGTDIRTVQELLGHTDIRTTEIYTHVVGAKFAGTRSPMDV